MIEVRQLSKRYGKTIAVDELTFDVRPGIVTGFLGPNGAGKSTTMRMILGLDRPTRGSVTVDGRSYSDHPAPLGDVGALLEARAIHPGRTARNHLRTLAATHGIGTRRVAEVLDLVGLTEVADRRVKAFSLGMGQRLGIATALLADPGTLILDEPVNGLDPEGIRWVRNLLRGLAAEGRTVFVSSHLMSEMALTAEHLVVIGRGRMMADTSVEEFVRTAGKPVVRVVSPENERLATLLGSTGEVAVVPDRSLSVTGWTSAAIGDLAREHGVALHELTPQHASLEEAFMEMTSDAVEYVARDGGQHDLVEEAS